MARARLRQPVITGLGIVSPIGIGVDAFWKNARAGQSGINFLSLPGAEKLPRPCQIAGEIRDFVTKDWMGGVAGRMAGRFSQFAVAASKMAREDAELALSGIPPQRTKVAIGSSVNGLVDVQEPTFEAFLRGDRFAPWTAIEFPGHAATSHVGAEAGALGQPVSFATACCAGHDAIWWAAGQVRNGHASAVIAGATDTPLSPYILSAFHACNTLSTWEGPPEEASRPFDALRSGLVLAEGAAAVVIEDEDDANARGAKIYARILGFGSSSEGGELRSVDETGTVTAEALGSALRSAGLTPGDIDYICAHGNSMVNYDHGETAGIKLAFGRKATSIPVSSIKSMCGHALAAAGAMQVVASCLVLRDEIIPPTINQRQSDPKCDLDYVANAARPARVRTVLTHSHSIGGTHMALVLGVPV